MNVKPNNNLDQFRKRSSFNERLLYNFLFSADVEDFRIKVQSEFKKHPVLYTSSPLATIDEQQRISCQRLSILRQLKQKFNNEITSNEDYLKVWYTCLWYLEISSVLQYIINVEMVPSAIKSLGTVQHIKFYKKILNGEYISSFALTEVGHGSNTKRIQTTATYDKDTQEFVLNTPSFQSAKCWIGNLSKIGTHSAVYAQLITPDGVNHGMHTFIVEVKDLKTHRVHNRIVIADVGEKIELNGIDNSVMIFDQYRIPRENLLNRLHDVLIDGTYITRSEIKNPFAFSLGVLSNSRIAIACLSSGQMCRTITIAIRYVASKTHPGNTLVNLLEDPTYQVGLFPHLALSYISKVSTDHLLTLQNRFFLDLTKHGFSEMAEEMHAITSAAKPVLTWLVLNGIRECLYACEECSYLVGSSLGTTRNFFDANCTYEGDNTVLIQQTSNWLLKQWIMKLAGKNINLPLSTIDYINDASTILNETFQTITIQEFIKPRNVLTYYKWLVCHLLKRCHEKQEHIKSKKSNFWAKNESQVFFCRDLVFAYMQAYMIRIAHLAISTVSDVGVKHTLNNLLALFGIWNLQKHVSHFYEGGYAVSITFAQRVEEAILFLCKEVENDAVALVSVIAPPDEFINSTFGHSDGQVNRNIMTSVFQVSDAFSELCWSNTN
ncbi:hypothetical protein FQR65_LT07447 [Abscondita terminalis]|nr:hypothetical protein FQR65_LT07447 [Abscondita terminalis]